MGSLQMKGPHVSVVMVVRNVDHFLAESIESVLGQTYTDFEFIIVDFGSTDSSLSIVSRYAKADKRIRLQVIPECGLAEARNAGCRLARGQYIAIMDADDVCVPDRVKWEVEFMEAHPEVGLLGGAAEWIDAKGRSLSMSDFPTSDTDLRKELATRCAFCQPTVLMREKPLPCPEGIAQPSPPRKTTICGLGSLSTSYAQT